MTKSRNCMNSEVSARDDTLANTSLFSFFLIQMYNIIQEGRDDYKNIQEYKALQAELAHTESLNDNTEHKKSFYARLISHLPTLKPEEYCNIIYDNIHDFTPKIFSQNEEEVKSNLETQITIPRENYIFIEHNNLENNEG